MSTVRLTNVEKRYGAVQVVRGVSFQVEPGQLLALLGPSGCGKTTTLRLIAGLETPDSGCITIGSRTVDEGRHHVAPENRGLGMVFQSYAVWPHRSVEQNIAYPLVLQKRSRDDIAKRVSEALGWVRLNGLGQRMPHQLSGGQLQRVALARALVANPAVLLLDEPLSNLDVALRDELRGEIAALRARLGTTTILVTHDQAEALALADSVAVMRLGRIEQLASPEVIYRDPATPFVAGFVGGASLLEGQASNGIFTTGGMHFVLPPELKHHAGRGTLAVRRDNVSVSTTGDGTLLALGARLFAGDKVEYRFTVGEAMLRVTSAPVAGDALRVTIDRAQFLIQSE